MHLLRTSIFTALLLALLCLPAAGWAVEAEPRAVEDPPAAFEPDAPVTPAPTVEEPVVEESVDSLDEGVATANAGGEIAELALDEPTTAAVTSRVATTGGAPLPFTGAESDRNLVIVLVALLSFLGGITLFAVPRRTLQSDS
jgi:hypothetical protein